MLTSVISVSHPKYSIMFSFDFDLMYFLSQWTALVVVGLEQVVTCKMVEDLVLL